MSRRGASGYVYLARGGHGLYKIGKSIHPGRRLTDIAAMAGAALQALHTVACLRPYRIEAALHACFAHAATRGEWFRLTDEEVALVCSLKDVDGERGVPDWLAPSLRAQEERSAVNPWVSATISVPASIAAAMQDLAARNGRSVSVEVCHAMERHFTEPPVLVTPPLSPAGVDDAAPRRKPGRPKKQGG